MWRGEVVSREINKCPKFLVQSSRPLSVERIAFVKLEKMIDTEKEGQGDMADPVS
jgi:hypothetical protein